ncbi:MAG: hypothetical protein HGB23_00390 [Chlorobiaceae bacterium]|nr:hypothetical protein [Chlorobiaceae bacterium]
MDDTSHLIEGIYTYCDRWCERCAFTSRCLQFQVESGEEESSTPLKELDVLNAGFWQEMGEALLQAMRVVQETALTEGAGVEDLQKESVQSDPPESLYHSAREHPCSTAALHYAGMVNEWFAAVDEHFEDESLLPAALSSLEEPVEIIRRYQYFIYPKMVRAVEGRMNDIASGINSADNDANGSAKIALITIDRSLAAWSRLYTALPSRENSTLSLLLHLDRLRRSVEALFPAARSFKRPGLDV